MKMKRALLLLLVLAAVSGLAFAKGATEAGGKPKIVIATDATWPPMEMVNESKQIVGFDIDLMKAAAEAGGFSVEFRNTAWDGIFAGLEAGEYDAVMSSVTITDERKQTMDFSVPYINAGQILVVRKQLTGVDKLDQLRGQERRGPDRHHGSLRDREGRRGHPEDLRRDRPGLRGPGQRAHRGRGLRHPGGRAVRPAERQLQGQAEDRGQAVHR